MVQLSHPYMTSGKTIALTIETFVGKVLLFNKLSRFVTAFLPRGKCFEFRSVMPSRYIHVVSNGKVSLFFKYMSISVYRCSGNSDRLYFLGLQNHCDGDCSHEIKSHLLIRRKTMTNLDSILKSRDSTLLTKVHLVKAMVFPVVMYGCKGWTIKKSEC